MAKEKIILKLAVKEKAIKEEIKKKEIDQIHKTNELRNELLRASRQTEAAAAAEAEQLARQLARRRQLVTKLRQLATYRPAVEQGAEVGQARPGRAHPAPRLPVAPLPPPLHPHYRPHPPPRPPTPQHLPGSAFAPQQVSSPVQISKLDISTRLFRPPRRAWRQDVRRAP